MSAKRGSVFDQGRPEDPYTERDEAEPARKATAAQMATRKIKAAKGRRAPGVSSGLSHTIAQPSGFGFGGGDNNNNNNNSSGANPFGFGSQPQSSQETSLFGGGATNSFPPTQPPQPASTFSSSSFPAFGGNSTNTSFNPQPPTTGFNFTAGGNNPFAASAPSAGQTNGNGSGGFSGSIFNTGSQSTTTPFAGFGQNNTSSTTPSSNMFGTSGTPQSTLFGGGISSAQNSAPTATAAPANPFGSLAAASPAAPTSPFNFGSTQPVSAPAQENTPTTKPLFGSLQPASTTAQETTPVSKPTLFGTPLAKAPTSSSAASSPAPFSLFGTKTLGESTGSPATGSAAFNTSTSVPQSSSGSTPAPASSLFTTKKPEETNNNSGKPLFASFGAASQGATSSTPTSGFNFLGTASNSAKDNASPSAPPATTADTTQSGSASISTSAPSLFKSFGPTSTKPDAPASTSLFKSFGPTSTTSTTKTDVPASSLFSASTPGNAFGGLQSNPLMATKSTSDVTKESESSTPAPNVSKTPFSTSTTSSSSGLFSQSFQPKASDSNSSSFPQPTPSKTPSLFSQSQPAKPQENNIQPSLSSAPFSLFNKPTPSDASKELGPSSTPPTAQAVTQPAVQPVAQPVTQSTPQPNAFKNLLGTPSATQQHPSSNSSMPNLTGGAAPPPETSQPDQPIRFGRVHLPANWGTTKGWDSDLQGLAIQIGHLNQQYREKLAKLPLTADWSALSQFHMQKTHEITQKIRDVRKQAAAAKGITGHESSLSIKRKAATEDDNHSGVQDASPSKKPRSTEAPSTPTPKYPTLPTTTPKASPPASNTSNLFGSVLNKSTDTTGMNAEKTTEPSQSTSSQPSQSTSSQSGFSFLSNGSKPAASQSPFQMPSSGSTGKASLFGSGGGLLGQFSSKAKTYEQLVAERKAKDKEEDYDSDEETEEQWSARWDKQEAERVAKEKEESTPTVQASSTPKSSNGAGLNLLSSFSKPANGASTPGFLTSRVGSPAPSTGGKSVFDTPETALSPASNPFAHLSSGPSSNNQDEDDDNSEDEQRKGATEQPSTLAQAQPRKRKVFDDTESESGESAEDTSKRSKVDTVVKPSLADRITRDPSKATDDESEKENGDPSEATAQGNGIQTPAKPFAFFDFGKAAGAQSAPPKPDKFAGDQTFKPGTPIKFGSAVKDNPTFQFQPATPSLGDFSATPSKPPPASTFSFLNAGGSSTPGSVLSSRAPTPLSEAETSGKDSAAETEDDEGEKHAQVDLSELTDEEKDENEILFHTEQALCKHQVDRAWVNYARGRLWILKNKQSGKAFVRMRLSSGNTMLNYSIYPKLKTNVTGSSKKMVSAFGMKKDGKTGNIFFAVKTPEIAAEFSNTYNANLPA